MERINLDHSVSRGFSRFSPKSFLWLVIAVVALIALSRSCTIVPPGHRGVSVTLGKVSQNIRGEGLNFKKPFIETIVKIPIQQITVDGETECFSSDLQTIKVSYSVLYKLPPDKIIELYQLFHGDPYASLVDPRIQDALKQATAKYKAEEMVKQREAVKVLAKEIVIREVTGMVTIVDVPLKNIDLTAQLEKAIEDKQVQEQQALSKTYELQKAQKAAEITIVEAKAEAEAVKIKGEALKIAPEVIQLEIAKKWNGVSPTSVVVTQGGANILLPLK
jgi:prohibitin 2